MNINKLKEVLSNKEFVEDLFQLETSQQVSDALKDKGVEISAQEVESIHDILVRYENNELTEKEKKLFEQYESQDGELSEDELENVSGGFGIFFIGACAVVVGLGLVQGGFLAHSLTRGRW